jgi:hypothetical protein
MFQRSLLPPSSEWALMMEAPRTSETVVNFYHPTWCYNPEDSHLCIHTHSRFNTHQDANPKIKICLKYLPEYGICHGMHDANLTNLLHFTVQPQACNTQVLSYLHQIRKVLAITIYNFNPHAVALLTSILMENWKDFGSQWVFGWECDNKHQHTSSRLDLTQLLNILPLFI